MLRLRRQQAGILDGQGGDILGTPKDRWSTILDRAQGSNTIPLGGSRYDGDDQPVALDEMAINVQPQVDPNPRTISDVTPNETARFQNLPMSLPDGEAVQNDAAQMNPMAIMPQQSDAARRLAELNNRDYSITKDEQGNVIGRGKDRDKTHNWKDILRSTGLGALSGLQSGGLGGIFGGAIAGTVRGAVDRNYDNKMQDEMFVRPRLEAQVGRERADAAYQMDQQRQQAQIENLQMKPMIEAGKLQNQTRANFVRQYNSLKEFNDNDPDDRAFGDAYEKEFGFRPPTKNADTKSEQIIDQRDGQVYIMKTDKQGKSEVIRVLNDDGTPMKIESKEMLASSDKAKQRSLDAAIRNSINVTNLKVAQINAGTRLQTTQMQQEGANYRQAQQIANTRELAKIKWEERRAAEAKNDQETVKKIDLEIAKAKAKAKNDGLTDKQIEATFGGL